MATERQGRNLELARGGLESWIAGDREAVMGTLSAEVEVFVPPELGNAGTFKGREEFLKWVAEWDEAWSEFDMEVSAIEPVGEDHVIAQIRSRGTGVGSGIEVENELGWVLRVREGLMDYLALQADLVQARAHAQERESAG